MIQETVLELREVILGLTSDADTIGLSCAEVSSLIGLAEGAWPMTVPVQWAPGLAEWQEARLRHLAELCVLLDRVFGPDAASWLRRKNGATGLTPLSFLESDGSALRALRDVLRAEQEAML